MPKTTFPQFSGLKLSIYARMTSVGCSISAELCTIHFSWNPRGYQSQMWCYTVNGGSSSSRERPHHRLLYILETLYEDTEKWVSDGFSAWGCGDGDAHVSLTRIDWRQRSLRTGEVPTLKGHRLYTLVAEQSNPTASEPESKHSYNCIQVTTTIVLIMHKTMLAKVCYLFMKLQQWNIWNTKKFKKMKHVTNKKIHFLFTGKPKSFKIY